MFLSGFVVIDLKSVNCKCLRNNFFSRAPHCHFAFNFFTYLIWKCSDSYGILIQFYKQLVLQQANPLLGLLQVSIIASLIAWRKKRQSSLLCYWSYFWDPRGGRMQPHFWQEKSSWTLLLNCSQVFKYLAPTSNCHFLLPSQFLSA